MRISVNHLRKSPSFSNGDRSFSTFRVPLFRSAGAPLCPSNSPYACGVFGRALTSKAITLRSLNFRLVSPFSTSLKEGDVGSPAPPSPPPRTGVLGKIDKLKSEAKRMFFTYGWLAVGTYFGVWLCTISSVYAGLQFGLLPSPDLNAFLNGLSLKTYLFGPEPLVIPEWGRQLAVAFVVTKTTEPIRIVVVLGLVPSLVKRLPAGVLRLFGVKKLP